MRVCIVYNGNVAEIQMRRFIPAFVLGIRLEDEEINASALWGISYLANDEEFHEFLWETSQLIPRVRSFWMKVDKNIFCRHCEQWATSCPEHTNTR